MSRREAVLLVTAGMALALWTGRPGEELPRGPIPRGAERPQDVLVVRVASLRAGAVPYDPSGRDLFGYARRPQPLRERPELPSRPEPEPVPPTVAHAAPTVAPGVPGAPLPGARYLGAMGPRGSRLAFFDRGGELLMVEEGEVFLRDFRLVEIGHESVTVGYTAGELRDVVRELPMGHGR